MIKRTIEISREQVYLSVRNDQLAVQPRGVERHEATTIPCEDVGLLLIDEPATTLSVGSLRALMRHGATVVICGKDHLPCGLLLPFSRHGQVTSRLREQIAVKKPLQKQLWKQLVVAKIRAQASLLEPASLEHRKLLALAGTVRSGDPSNVEAQAAKVYWRVWLFAIDHVRAKAFRRDPEGEPPNNLLNYGYAVLRAAVARALVCTGLQPALGLHHHNRSNPFCLADDLLEPLRPIVDARVRSLTGQGRWHLDQPTKAALLELLTDRVRVAGETGPLAVALHRMATSLVKCYADGARQLDIPVVDRTSDLCSSAVIDACGS